MRILRLTRLAPPDGGGMQRHIGELSVEQVRAGHEVHVVFAAGGDRDLPGVSMTRLPIAWQQPVSLGAWLLGRAAYRWVRRHQLQFDLVHAHGDYAEAHWAKRIAATLGCPAVLSIHGAFGPPHRWRDARRRRDFVGLSHLFPVSGDILAKVRSLGVEVPGTVQHSGTRTAMFAAIERSPDPQPRLLSLGALVPFKGYAYLIEAMRLLRTKWPEVSLDILGDGPLRDSLRASSADLSCIHWYGQADRQTICERMAGAWVYVQPSIVTERMGEGTPTAVIEAMAAGLPVVGSAVGGLAEIVDHEVNGLLVPPEVPGRLADALDRMITDATLRARCAQANRPKGAGADWPLVAARITQVCEQVVADHRRPRAV